MDDEMIIEVEEQHYEFRFFVENGVPMVIMDTMQENKIHNQHVVNFNDLVYFFRHKATRCRYPEITY